MPMVFWPLCIHFFLQDVGQELFWNKRLNNNRKKLVWQKKGGGGVLAYRMGFFFNFELRSCGSVYLELKNTL